MSPLQVEILLHYHCSNADFRDLDAPAINDAILGFITDGILIRNSLIDGVVSDDLAPGTKYYANREATQIYVDTVCSLPRPRRVWKLLEPERVPDPCDEHPSFLRKIMD